MFQAKSDVILGWVESTGRVFVGDYWASGYQAPKLDDVQDIKEIKGSIEDGRTTLSFLRKRATNDLTQVRSGTIELRTDPCDNLSIRSYVVATVGLLPCELNRRRPCRSQLG